MKFRSGWVSLEAMLVALSVSPAFGQTSEVPRASATVEDVRVGSENPTLSEKSEKQATALQEAPRSAAVITSSQIENAQITNVEGIRKLVPSLSLRWNNVQNLSYNIRGLGNSSSSQLVPVFNGVGIYVDGVYLPRPGSWTTDIPDLDSVQVYKGPSATLGGYDDVAGRLYIRTAAPSFTPQQKVEISYGTYNAVQLKASATGPLFDSDWAAFRIAVFGKDRDGYIQGTSSGSSGGVDYQDIHTKGARAQLLLQPTNDLSVRFIGDWSHIDTKCCVKLGNGLFTNYANGAAFAPNFLTRAAAVGYSPLQTLGVLQQFNNYNVDLVTATPTERTESYGISSQVDYSGDDFNISSLTSLRGFDYHPYWLNNQTINVDTNTASHGHPSVKAVQHDTKISSQAGEPVEVAGGLFFYWEDFLSWGLSSYGTKAGAWFQPTQPLAVANAALSGAGRDTYVHVTSTQIAPYVQGTWHAAPEIDINAGVRFSYTGKTGVALGQTYGPSYSGLTVAQQATAATLRSNLLGPAYYYYTANTDQGLWSGFLSATYKVTPDIGVYATYSHGARPGGPNVSTSYLPSGASTTIKPEESHNFEVGLKSTFLDNRLLVNAAVFDQINFNYITNVTQINAGGASVSYLANAKRVISRGVEVDVRAKPIDGLEVYGSAVFTDAFFQSFENSPCPLELTNLASAGLRNCNFNGKRLPITSRWTMSSGALYSHPLGFDIPYLERASIGFVGVDFNWQSRYYSDATDSVYAQINPYGLLNFNLGVKTDDEKWKLTGWVHNALDKRYFTNLQGNLLSGGLIGGTVGDPIMGGVALAVTF
ncbi:TonB-dependent receptor [Methylosinus sp. H3A]|uniref:TonB-dependent receptor n=1 Tax=Methylosinus sp. H3A TaxID=2785786 RepID=UPI0018C2E51A|nr:TonB-dependent receptor [Methylosinus sp. H3A]MBG0808284.1 TonB-dependent receptor [Methylosinus sp. H3A]